MMATELLLSQKLTMPSVCGNRCSFVFICLQHCSGACRVVRTCIHIHTHTNMHIHTDVLMCIYIYTYREREAWVYGYVIRVLHIYIYTHTHMFVYSFVYTPLSWGLAFCKPTCTQVSLPQTLSLYIYIYIDL